MEEWEITYESKEEGHIEGVAITCKLYTQPLTWLFLGELDAAVAQNSIEIRINLYILSFKIIFHAFLLFSPFLSFHKYQKTS